VRETFADGTMMEWTLDADDNPVQFKDQNGSVFTNAFDGLHRRVRVDVARAPGIVGTTIQTFEFDGLSRGGRMTDNNDPADPGDDAVCEHSFDSLSRVIEERQNPGDGTLRAVSSAWFSGERRTAVTYPSNRRIQTTFDALDRQKTLRDAAETTPLASYTYIGPVRVKQRDYQNGTRLSIAYDGDRRPVEWRHTRMGPGPTLLLGFSHAWDREWNKQFERFLHRVGDSRDEFQYDSLYRVTGVTYGNQAGVGNQPKFGNEYVLDGVDNWRRFTRTRGNQTLFDDTNTVNEMNEYESFQNTAQTHDENGNLTQIVEFRRQGPPERVEKTTRYRWDAFNRLALVEEAGPSGQFKPVARYGYYADNRRSFKVVAGQAFGGGQLTLTTGAGQATVAKFFYDGWRTVEEQSLGVQTEATYVCGPMYLDEHVAMDRQNPGGVVRRFFYHQNTIFNVMGLTDASGQLAETWAYDIYGRAFRGGVVNFNAPVEPIPSTVPNPYLFTGHRVDPSTAFYWMRHRYYSPDAGRFISRDPLGWVAGPNSYGFASNAPTNKVDPSGLVCCCESIEIADRRGRGGRYGPSMMTGLWVGPLARDGEFGFGFRVRFNILGNVQDCHYTQDLFRLIRADLIGPVVQNVLTEEGRPRDRVDDEVARLSALAFGRSTVSFHPDMTNADFFPSQWWNYHIGTTLVYTDFIGYGGGGGALPLDATWLQRVKMYLKVRVTCSDSFATFRPSIQATFKVSLFARVEGGSFAMDRVVGPTPQLPHVWRRWQ
jgi:RHS repeat-associated protein